MLVAEKNGQTMWDHDERYDNMMNGSGGAMTVFAVMALVLLLVATVAVLFNLYHHTTQKPERAVRGGEATPEARLVLDARLARGEVPADEYRALRALLDGD